jgi:hypothetical protein
MSSFAIIAIDWDDEEEDDAVGDEREDSVMDGKEENDAVNEDGADDAMDDEEENVALEIIGSGMYDFVDWTSLNPPYGSFRLRVSWRSNSSTTC